MIFTVYETTTGQVLFCGDCAEPETLCKVGQSVFLNEKFIDGWILDGVHSSLPTRPSDNHHFNYVNKQWEDPRTLQQIKAIQNDYINTSRLNANQSTFPFMGNLIAVDGLSRSDIDAVHGIVVLTGAMPEGWVGGWKTVENTYVSIPDVATWTSFYKSMVGQGSLNFAHAQSLKTRLASATTIDEVDAIVW